MTTCATPGLPLAARAEDGHLMVELLPRLQALPTASTRNSVKFAVVPEESDRTASVIAVLGRLTPDEVWTAAHVDEDWNVAQWGLDEEVAARRAARLVPRPAAGFQAAADGRRLDIGHSPRRWRQRRGTAQGLVPIGWAYATQVEALPPSE